MALPSTPVMLIPKIVRMVLKNRATRINREPSEADIAEVMGYLDNSTNKSPYSSPEQMIRAIEAAVHKYEDRHLWRPDPKDGRYKPRGEIPDHARP